LRSSRALPSARPHAEPLTTRAGISWSRARIADSITPGWQQIGAVWLPLPHLLNAIPVTVDFFYRTGASSVAISIRRLFDRDGCARLDRAGADRIGRRRGGRCRGVFALNPNVLYLQSTPMTEPLLLATTDDGGGRC